MPSVFAWLDYSAEDQRRAREIVGLFSQSESRDELGIGTVRDVLSDLMFPGISVIQTRARYFLFVPWLFRQAARQGYSGHELLSRVDRQERQLIESLRSGGDQDGLIGRVAGVRLKILPSTIYWNGMQRFGILRPGATQEEVAGAGRHIRSLEDAIDELVDRNASPWDLHLPTTPPDFFGLESCTFALEAEEAEWLRERVLASVPGTLLSYLVERLHRPEPESIRPWDDPFVADAPGPLRDVVQEAWRFSTAMNGAALLYNLLLQERCESLGVDGGGADYRQLIGEWSASLANAALGLAGWDLRGFFARMRDVNPRIHPQTEKFIKRWIEGALAAGVDVGGNVSLRTLVEQREISLKTGQARLRNDRLLRQWGGASGAEPLSFRWSQVKRIVGDIVNGVERGDA